MVSVVFEVRPADGRRDACLALAAEMRPVLESIDGFLDDERFARCSRPCRILSHSTWRDGKAAIRGYAPRDRREAPRSFVDAPPASEGSVSPPPNLT